MYAQYLVLTCSLLALLRSTAASPYDKYTPHWKVTPTATAIAVAACPAETIVVTETLVLDKSSKSPFVLPSAEASLTYPNPNEACIVDGIAIWQSSTPVTSDTSDPVASATSFKTTVHTATIPHPAETHNTTKSARPNKHSTFTTSLLPALSQTRTSPTGLHVSQFNTNTPTPTPASSKSRNIDTSSFDPVAWAQDTPRLHTKRSSNNAPTRSKHFFFFVAAHPQTHTKHQQIVRDEDEDEQNHHRSENTAHPTKHQQIARDEDENEEFHHVEALPRLKECYACEKGRSLVCINGTHYGYCDEGCAEPRMLREGMKCVDGRIYGVRGWRGRME